MPPVVDVAFSPQVNEFRGERTVQMNVLDIRPSCTAECPPDTAGYASIRTGKVTAADAARLTPDRNMLGMVWRYLAQRGPVLKEEPVCLCRKIVRWSNQSLSLGQLLVCLDIFREADLLQTQRIHKYLHLTLTPGAQKADLNRTQTMQTLLNAKES